MGRRWGQETSVNSQIAQIPDFPGDTTSTTQFRAAVLTLTPSQTRQWRAARPPCSLTDALKPTYNFHIRGTLVLSPLRRGVEKRFYPKALEIRRTRKQTWPGTSVPNPRADQRKLPGASTSCCWALSSRTGPLGSFCPVFLEFKSFVIPYSFTLSPPHF